MDRRSFLTLLGTVGVLTGAPKWLLDPIMREKLAPGLELPDEDVSQWLDPPDLAVYGREQTFEFAAAHTGESGVAVVDVRRLPEDGGGIVLRWWLNPGGIVRWSAAPGEEIYGPLRIVAPAPVQSHVIGTDARGRMVAASKDGVVPLHPY